MPDDTTNPSLDVRATLDTSSVQAGAPVAAQAIAGIAAATTEAERVAALYSVSLKTAEEALVILGATAGTAMDNIVELDAAMDLAQSNALAAAASTRIYNEALVESARQAMITSGALTEMSVASDAAGISEGASTAVKFGRGSPFFHAMVSAVNISRGGTMALRGFFEAIELASFALPGFIGPLLLLAATIYEVTEWLEKHKKTVKETGEEWSTASIQVGIYEAALKNVLASQKDQLEADDRLTQNAKDRAGLLNAGAKQDTEKELQALRGQYLKDQAGATSDDDRKELKDRYEAAVKDIKAGGTVNTALLDSVEAAQQLDIATKKLKDAQDAAAKNTLAAAQAFGNAQDARSRLDPHGIGLNKDGKGLTQIDAETGKSIDPIAEQEKGIDDTQSKINFYSAALANGGLSGEDEKADKDALDEYKRRIIEQRQARDQMQADLASLQEEKEAGKTLGPDLKSALGAIAKMQEEVDKLKGEVSLKNEAVSIAETTREQDRSQGALDADAATDDRFNKGYKQAMHDLSILGRKTVHDKAAADRASSEASRHAESAEEKSTRQQIESAIGGVEATGNKPLIAAMRKVVDLFKGKTDETSQLAELAALTDLHVEQMTTYKAQTDAHLKSLDHAVKSGRRNHDS